MPPLRRSQQWRQCFFVVLFQPQSIVRIIHIYVYLYIYCDRCSITPLAVWLYARTTVPPNTSCDLLRQLRSAECTHTHVQSNTIRQHSPPMVDGRRGVLQDLDRDWPVGWQQRTHALARKCRDVAASTGGRGRVART